MATLSTNLEIVLLAYGEEGYGAFDNYGDVENANWGMVEAALTEDEAITINASNVTLTDAQQIALTLTLTGTLTGNRNLLVQDGRKGFWFVTNSTSGAFSITIKPVSGSGVTVAAQGSSAVYYSDGSTVRAIGIDVGTFLTLTSPSIVENKSFVDATTFIIDNSDNTKRATFQTSGIATATTRTYALPDANGTIVLNDNTATLIAKTIEDGIFSNGYREEVYTANTGSAFTFDLANGSIQYLTLTSAAVTYTAPSAVAGRSFTLLQKQGAGGSTVTWPASFKWQDAGAPTLTATAGKIDQFTFTSDGTYWYGSVKGTNL